MCVLWYIGINLAGLWREGGREGGRSERERKRERERERERRERVRVRVRVRESE